MAEYFAVGEIAEIVYSRYERGQGMECTIVAPLRLRRNTITALIEDCYVIEVEGEKYCALPDQLRKKRPPQDWMSLCHLDEVPAEPRELETA